MKNLLTILMFSIFIWGCNDDIPNNPNGGNTVLTLDLISPLNATTGYCNIDFEWSASLDNIPFVLTISPNRNFLNHTVFRDTIVGTAFTLMQNLQPNKMYYWRVQADNISKMDSFMVQNVADLEDFTGTFPAIATYHHEAYPNDSTWTTNVEIVFNSDGIPQMTEVGVNLIVKPDEHASYANLDCDIFNYRKKIDWMNIPLNTLTYIEEVVRLDVVNRTFTFIKRIDSEHFDIYIDYTGSID